MRVIFNNNIIKFINNNKPINLLYKTETTTTNNDRLLNIQSVIVPYNSKYVNIADILQIRSMFGGVTTPFIETDNSTQSIKFLGGYTSVQVGSYAKFVNLEPNTKYTLTTFVDGNTTNNIVFKVFDATNVKIGTTTSIEFSTNELGEYEFKNCFYWNNDEKSDSSKFIVFKNISLVKNEVILIENISITPSNLMLGVGASQQLQAILSPVGANGVITWASGNATVATVSQTGLVTCLASGETEIYASVKGNDKLLGVCTLIVSDEILGNSYIEFPYISTYYFNPKPTIDTDVIIPVYITDGKQSEVLLNDNTKLFNIIYSVDGVEYTLNNLNAGDHTINLGKLTEGEHYFTIQVLDLENNEKSNVIYNDLLVINPATYNPKDSEIYTITDTDLSTYSINKNNSTNETDLVNTRLGLTNLFQSIKDEGYKKCILPNGTYRVDRTPKLGTGNEAPIKIPSNFIIDLNGSTIKNHMYTANEGSTMIQMDNCRESSIINGVLEGDFFERRDAGYIDGGLGESCSILTMYGGKYNSFENLTIKQSTGYAIMTMVTNPTDLGILNGWVDVDIINGVEQDSDFKTTCASIDISRLKQKNIEYIYFGVYLGFGGFTGKSWVIDVHFYDNNNQYINTIRGYQYRKVKIPDDAYFARITIIDRAENEKPKIKAYYFDMAYYTTFKNIDCIDTRTCAFAPAQFNNMLLDNCTFTRCGYSITPCAIDLEDGWNNMQDFYLMNSRTIEHLGGSTFIDCSGFNHVTENCDNVRLTIRNPQGSTIRNNTNVQSFKFNNSDYHRTAFSRIHDNQFNVLTAMYDVSLNSTPTIVRDCTINNSSVISEKYTSYYDNCVFTDITLGGYSSIRNSTITNLSHYLTGFNFYNCKFQKTDDTFMKFAINDKEGAGYKNIEKSTFNCKANFACNNGFVNGIFKDNIFNDEVMIQPKDVLDLANTMGDIQFNNCTFKSKVTIKTGQNYVQFNNCTFEGERIFQETANVNCEFNNCIIA